MADRTAVLFDVDGTLVDTNYLHTVAWWRAFRTEDITIPMSWLHATVGKGTDQFLPAILGDDLDPELARRLDEAHTHFYAPDLHGLVALPGAADLLRAVAQAGHRVVLASSCSSAEAVHLRAAIGADDVIDAMTDSGDVDATKPNPDLVHAALDAAGTTADRALMVGDTVWDVRAAKRAGVACVAVLCGGISEAALREAGALAIYDDPADLLARLAGSPIAELSRLRRKDLVRAAARSG
jgi:HAD superfamily hydrolase (TIGR01509 family)